MKRDEIAVVAAVILLQLAAACVTAWSVGKTFTDALGRHTEARTS